MLNPFSEDASNHYPYGLASDNLSFKFSLDNPSKRSVNSRPLLRVFHYLTPNKQGMLNNLCLDGAHV